MLVSAVMCATLCWARGALLVAQGLPRHALAATLEEHTANIRDRVGSAVSLVRQRRIHDTRSLTPSHAMLQRDHHDMFGGFTIGRPAHPCKDCLSGTVDRFQVRGGLMLELPSDDDSDYSLPVLDEAPGQKANASHAFRTHAQLWGGFSRAWSVTIARGSDIGSTTSGNLVLIRLPRSQK